MKNSKIILIAYSALFFMSLYFLSNFADMLLGARFVGEIGNVYLLSDIIQLKDLVGFLLASAVTAWFFLWKKGHYRKELDKIIDELLKVVWPGKEETRITTISVFVFVGIMMAVFFILDLVWSNAIRIIY